MKAMLAIVATCLCYQGAGAQTLAGTWTGMITINGKTLPGGKVIVKQEGDRFTGTSLIATPWAVPRL